MMKTLKNFEIKNILNGLGSEEVKDLSTKKLPVSFAWNLKKNVAKLVEIDKQIEESVNEIRSQYNDDEHSHEVENEDGKKDRVVNEEYVEEFVGKMNELYNQENEVEITTCPLSSLDGLDAISIAELNAIEFMVEE